MSDYNYFRIFLKDKVAKINVFILTPRTTSNFNRFDKRQIKQAKKKDLKVRHARSHKQNLILKTNSINLNKFT